VPPAFRLIDPRKQFDLNPNKPKIAKGPGPFITDFWSDDPIYDRSVLYAYQEKMNRPRPEDMNAVSLCRRMNALMAALQDLDGQALRMVKLHMRMQYRTAQTGKYQKRPMRPGLPPGYRQRQKHEVDEVSRSAGTATAHRSFKCPQSCQSPENPRGIIKMSRSTSAMFVLPQNAIVRSSSLRMMFSASVTPASPSAPRP